MFCIAMEICSRSLFRRINWHNSKLIIKNNNNHNDDDDNDKNTYQWSPKSEWEYVIQVNVLPNHPPLPPCSSSFSLCIRIYVVSIYVYAYNMICFFHFCLKFDAFMTNLFNKCFKFCVWMCVHSVFNRWNYLVSISPWAHHSVYEITLNNWIWN